ncbi:nitroreductase family protein [Kaistia dalseonensis]|uniref:Nitroreductase n=1 Tax=Kaistia dalseonensis TaxID=410840 RepID=A0ABU0H081_9HYPH|nr:nitroreductase family protein [Kaistia dalseonensis]MCX5493122.1 nitroreductase family protein [Kaistia dalseonensis]MDQ0435677.1 nitroreductase [Kaistia dalseonensis]
MRKPALTEVPILPVIAERWSPRAFDPERTLSEDDLKPLFEAARWAASSGNSQPWRFVYAFRGEPAFDALLACAAEGNQAWVKRASVLAYSVARLHSDSGRSLWHNRHDTGMALAHLLLQATANGLAVHPFGGFDSDKVIAAAGIPADFEPCTGVAIGYAGDPALLGEKDGPREYAERQRRPVSEFLFHGRWPQ